MTHLDHVLDLLYQAEKQSCMGHHLSARLFIQKARHLVSVEISETINTALRDRETIRQAKAPLKVINGGKQ